MSDPFKKEQYIIIYEPQGKYVHIHMKIIYGFNKKNRSIQQKNQKSTNEKAKRKEVAKNQMK